MSARSANEAGAHVRRVRRHSDTPGESHRPHRECVSGARINWSASGGSLSAASVASDPSGLAAVTFSATTPGLYSVVAGLAALATHTYPTPRAVALPRLHRAGPVG